MKDRIIPITEEAQQAKIAEYNQGKKRVYDKMPVVLRNHETGWPLLQVTAFSAIGGQRFEPVLGGMKCHEFPIAHFFLARLLAQVDGQKSVRTHLSPEEIPLDEFAIHNLYKHHLLDDFTFTHKHYGIIISTESGAYGKSTSVKLQTQEELGKVLHALLESAFNKALMPKSGIQPIAVGAKAFGADASHVYTATQLRQAVNPEYAVYINGNIFVDIGRLLESIEDISLRNACKDLFELIFKPKEFVALQVPVPAEPQPVDSVALSKTSALPGQQGDANFKKAQAEYLVEIEKAKKELRELGPRNPESMLDAYFGRLPDAKERLKQDEKKDVPKKTEAKEKKEAQPEQLKLIEQKLQALERGRVKDKHRDLFQPQPAKIQVDTTWLIEPVTALIRDYETSTKHNILGALGHSGRTNTVLALQHILDLQKNPNPEKLREFVEAMKNRQDYTDKSSGQVFRIGWSGDSKAAVMINTIWDKLNPQPAPQRKPPGSPS